MSVNVQVVTVCVLRAARSRQAGAVGLRTRVEVEVDVPGQFTPVDVARSPDHRETDDYVDYVVSARPESQEVSECEIREFACERPLQGEREGKDERIFHTRPARVPTYSVGERDWPGVFVGGDTVDHAEEEGGDENRPHSEADVWVPEVYSRQDVQTLLSFLTD